MMKYDVRRNLNTFHTTDLRVISGLKEFHRQCRIERKMQADDGPLPSFEGRLPSSFGLCTSALWILVPV